MKNAIVTGASNGIGLEISKKLSENDYHVGMIDVDKENHINQYAFLKPSESKKNISLWKKSSKTAEIRYIESQLGEYLYN